MKNLLAILMTALALALGACGDDNGDNASTSGNVATTGTITTGKTTTEDNGESKTTEESKSKSRSEDSESKSSKSKSSDTQSTTNSGKGAPSTTNKNAGKSEELYTEQSAENLSSRIVAQRICRGFLPERTVRELKSGKTTNQKVAKQYAEGWPAAKQQVAYKGCLQGLKARESGSIK